MPQLNHFLSAGRENPNGRRPSTAYLTSLAHADYSLVTERYVSGKQIAGDICVTFPSILQLHFGVGGRLQPGPHVL